MINFIPETRLWNLIQFNKNVLKNVYNQSFYWCTAKTFWIILILVLFSKISSVQKCEFSTLYKPWYRFLWSFGIQYKVDKSSYSSLIRIFIDDTNAIWLAKNLFFLITIILVIGLPEFFEINGYLEIPWINLFEFCKQE
jgi:hypothetical protein